MGHICIICAIQLEIRPILKRFPSIGISCSADFPAWRFQAFGKNITLIQSGIGVNKAAKAASAAAALDPEIIISAGFCGALSPSTSLGEVFLAEKLYHCSSGSITRETTPDPGLAALIGTGLRRGTFITTDEIIEKSRVCSLLPDPAAINLLEMESSAVADVCRSQGIRFSAIRSVSDTADHDPCSLFRRICDSDFNISMVKVALSLIKKPATLSEFLQLSRSSAIAGKSLSEAVAYALERI
jgi:adenosylhomocysteine nucleosidase